MVTKIFEGSSTKKTACFTVRFDANVLKTIALYRSCSYYYVKHKKTYLT